MQVFLVFALLISLFAVVFAVQNTAITTVSFLMWDFDNSLAVVILLTVFTGVLISILMSLPGWIKNRVYLMSIRKKNKDLETKLTKQEEKLQVTLQEVETLKNQIVSLSAVIAAPVTPTPVAPVSTPPTTTNGYYPPTQTYTPPATTAPVAEPAMPELEDLFVEEEPEAPVEEPVKKSKFPGIDRILNR
jgi:uncharacterized integral membrane protein